MTTIVSMAMPATASARRGHQTRIFQCFFRNKAGEFAPFGRLHRLRSSLRSLAWLLRAGAACLFVLSWVGGVRATPTLVAQGGAQYDLAIATTGHGSCVVVWEGLSSDNNGTDIFAVLTDAELRPLASPFRVNLDRGGYSEYPAVALDREGNFMVVWRLGTGGGSSGVVRARSFGSLGSPLTSELEVSAPTALTQGAPRVAWTPAGAFILAWDDAGIHLQGYDFAGQRLGAEIPTGPAATTDARNPDLGIDAEGNIALVWETFEAGVGYGVAGQRLSKKGGLLGRPFAFGRGTSPRLPRISVARAGCAAVVWRGRSSTYARTLAVDFTASGPELLVHTSDPFGMPQILTAANVAVFDDGGFAVVWEGYSTTARFQSHLQRFLATGSTDGDRVDFDQPALFPVLTADGADNVVVARKGPRGILAERFPGSGSSSAARRFLGMQLLPQEGLWLEVTNPAASPFLLQASTNLPGGDWRTVVTNTDNRTYIQLFVTNRLKSPELFFRLTPVLP